MSTFVCLYWLCKVWFTNSNYVEALHDITHSFTDHWIPAGYLFYNVIFIVTLLWAINSPLSVEAPHFAALIDFASFIFDLLCIIKNFPDYGNLQFKTRPYQNEVTCNCFSRRRIFLGLCHNQFSCKTVLVVDSQSGAH